MAEEAVEVVNSERDSTSSSSEVKEKDRFVDLVHKFEVVMKQVESGQAVARAVGTALKKAYTSGKTIPADDISKTAESCKVTLDKMEDAMAAHLGCLAMVMDLCQGAPQALSTYFTFLHDKAAVPLLEFCEEAEKRKKVIQAKEKKLSGDMAAMDNALKRDRQNCLKLFEELRAAEKEKQAEPSKASGLKKFETAKSKAHAAFLEFDKTVERANVQQNQYYDQDMPKLLQELDTLERDRLHACHVAVAQTMTAYGIMAETVSQALEPLTVGMTQMEADPEIKNFVSLQIARHGARPPAENYHVDLPCSAKDILEDKTASGGVAKIVWAENGSANQCMICNTSFTLFTRRHHCRKCGSLVCANCSQHKSVIDGIGTPVRVCDKCRGKSGQEPKVGPRATKIASPPKNNTSFKKSNSASGSTASASAAAGPPPVLTRALYDYKETHQGWEDAELHFSAGEVISVPADLIGSGEEWWRGTSEITGISGDFPAGYVEVVKEVVCIALYAHNSDEQDYLKFKPGELIRVISQDNEEWWYGLLNRKTGYFPASLVRPYEGLKNFLGGKTAA